MNLEFCLSPSRTATCFLCMKEEICFYILRKSSVLPSTIWRPSNVIVQFKWDINLFNNMKKFGYWEDRAALLTYMSSTLSSDVEFFSPCPTGFKLMTMTKKGDWILSLEKKDRSKSSSDWTRGRHNRHCRKRCTYRVYFNEYDSVSMIISITLRTKPLSASSTMYC